MTNLQRNRAFPYLAGASLACLICAHTLIVPIRAAAVIGRLGADGLPLCQVFFALGQLAVTPCFSWLANHRSPRQLMGLILLAAGICAVLLLPLAAGESRVSAVATYCIGGLGTSLAIAMLWGVIDSSNARERSRRLYGLLGVGNPIGGIVGALVAMTLPMAAASHWNVAASIGFLMATFVLIRWMVKSATFAESLQSQRSASTPAVAPTLVLHGTRRRMLSLVAIMGGANVAFLGWLMGISIEQITNKTGTAVGFISSRLELSTNVCALAMQLLVAAPLLRGGTVAVCLMITPIVAMGASASYAWSEPAAATALALVCYSALRYTLDQCSREMIYVGSDADTRFKAKLYIDGGFTSAGRIVGAGLTSAVIYFTDELGVGSRGGIGMGLTFVWLVIAWRLGATQTRPEGRDNVG